MYMHYAACINTTVCVPSFNSFDEVVKSGKLRVGSPDPQSGHVGHVPRFRGSSGTAVHNPSLGKLLLQLQDSQPSLTRLAGTGGHKIFGFVAFIKHNLRVILVKELLYKTADIRIRFPVRITNIYPTVYVVISSLFQGTSILRCYTGICISK